MIRSLRAKLAFSHIISVLLLLPLLSLYLLYALERFYTDNLLQQLVYQSQLVRDEIERNPALTASADATKDFFAALAPLSDSRVMLLDQTGTIQALTRKGEAGRIGSRLTYPEVTQVLHGEMAKGVGPGFATEVAYVMLPLRQNGQTTGALRLSYEVGDVRAQFSQLRWLVGGGVGLAVAMAFGLAWGLATTITRPLHQLSESAQKIAAGDYHARVAARGHDEVGVFARSFNQMIERLEAAEQARERQLAAIAHELTRPLSGMTAAVETLRDGADADQETRDTLLDGIEAELERLVRLVGTLQNLHKRALRPMRLDRSEISLERVIRAAVTNFEPAAAELGVALSVDLPSDLPRVCADEDRVIQVLTNLLDNAFKFTPRSGRVIVQAGEGNQGVWISVADTGIGIAPDELPHIFQQFYRGDESRLPEKRGMGLGLAICREIVTAHQGQIWVESEPEKGARFTFTLPKE